MIIIRFLLWAEYASFQARLKHGIPPRPPHVNVKRPASQPPPVSHALLAFLKSVVVCEARVFGLRRCHPRQVLDNSLVLFSVFVVVARRLSGAPKAIRTWSISAQAEKEVEKQHGARAVCPSWPLPSRSKHPRMRDRQPRVADDWYSKVVSGVKIMA